MRDTIRGCSRLTTSLRWLPALPAGSASRWRAAWRCLRLRVVVNGRDSGKVAAVVASMKSDGPLAHAAVFDVTDPECVERGVASIEHEIGPIYVLVNNAGIQRRMPLEDFPARDVARAYAVTNLTLCSLSGRRSPGA